MWNIYGELWKNEWTASPDGFSTQISPNASNHLYYLNILRNRIIKPLLSLEEKFKEPMDGMEFAKAIYQYLIDTKTNKMLKIRINQLENIGESILADRMDRLWDIVMEILNMFAVTTKTKHECNRYIELFRFCQYYKNKLYLRKKFVLMHIFLGAKKSST